MTLWTTIGVRGYEIKCTVVGKFSYYICANRHRGKINVPRTYETIFFIAEKNVTNICVECRLQNNVL